MGPARARRPPSRRTSSSTAALDAHRRAQRGRLHRRRSRPACRSPRRRRRSPRDGPDARARPAAAASGDGRRRGRHRRLRAAAPPLRRAARPRARRRGRARRRHRRARRRHGDQERRRLRPGQAHGRLVRHARRDHRGLRAAAPAARAAPRPRSSRRDDPARSRRAAARAGRAARWRPRRSTSRWDGGEGAVLVALRRRRRAADARPRARCGGRGSIERRRRRAVGGASARASARAGGAVVRVAGAARRPRARARAPPRRRARVGRAALGLAWLDGSRRGGRRPSPRCARALAPAPCVRARRARALRAAVDPWGVPAGPELELMRRRQGALRPGAACCNPGRLRGRHLSMATTARRRTPARARR